VLPEIVLGVLSFCDLHSIYMLCATCSRFYGLATEVNLLALLRKFVPSRDTTNLNFNQVFRLCRYPYIPPRIIAGLDGTSLLKEGTVRYISWDNEMGEREIVNKGCGDVVDISVCGDLFCILTDDNCISCWTEGMDTSRYELGFNAVQVSVDSTWNDEGWSIILLSSDNQVYHVVWNQEGCTAPELHHTEFPVYRLSGWKLVDFDGNMWGCKWGSGVTQMMNETYSCNRSVHRDAMEKRGVSTEGVDEVFYGGDEFYYLLMKDGGVKEVNLDSRGNIENRRHSHFHF